MRKAVEGLIRDTMSGRTLDQVRALCAARLASDLVPSRSAIGRVVRRERREAKQSKAALARDAEMIAFVRERLPSMTLDNLRAALAQRFPDRAIPSRSALGRFRLATRPGRRSTIEDNLELSIMVRALAGKVSIDRLLAACREAFPRSPVSRSALHRFVQEELHVSYGLPAGKRHTGAGK